MSNFDESLPTQWRYTEAIVDATPDDGIIVSNLGVSSWILSAVEDRDRNYYMKGAMGTTTPLGLGLAVSRDEQVTVLDGDGSLLMSLGSLSTVARQEPSNLIIVVMNNSAFATTGGQPSLANEVDIAAVAADCGFWSADVDSLEAFEKAYQTATGYNGPSLINCTMTTTVPDSYPEPDYAHSYRKHRFRTALEE